MVQYQKYMFDNFVVTCDEQTCIGEELEVPLDEDVNVVDNVEEQLKTEEKEIFDLEFEDKEDASENENISSDFEEIDVKIEEETAVAYTQDELDTAVEAAEIKGYEKGKEEALKTIENAQQEVLQKIDESLKVLADACINLEQEAENSAMQIAICAINKILPTLEHDVAKKEVEAFLSDNFGNFRKETSLSFSFHPDMTAQIAPILSKLADKNDFEGKIAVHKDMNLGLSDCKVEWKNGGVERNSAQITDKIKELMSK